MTHRPRILVLNQYYWPGVEATAHLLSQLCEELTSEFDVTVVTGCLRGVADRPEKFTRNGVDVVRVPSSAFDRAPLGFRALNYASYLGSSWASALKVPRPDIVLCMTDPPILGSVGLFIARRFRVPFVVVTQDIFPEVAVELGRIDNPVLIDVIRRTIRFYLRRADAVVAIGETMRKRLEVKGARPERISVIPNWANTDEVTPQPRDNEWAQKHGLTDRFVVMHSGNVGYAQDLDSLIRSATLLRDMDSLSIVIIGTGARRDILRDMAQRNEADAVRFLPYQPRETVSFSLSSGDLHYVGLARGLAGYVVPSRLYGIMAAARPVLVSADSDCETARLVTEVGCGVVVPPGRPDLVARAIRDLSARPDDLEEMGRRGYEYVVEHASRSVAARQYASLLRELTAPR